MAVRIKFQCQPFSHASLSKAPAARTRSAVDEVHDDGQTPCRDQREKSADDEQVQGSHPKGPTKNLKTTSGSGDSLPVTEKNCNNSTHYSQSHTIRLGSNRIGFSCRGTYRGSFCWLKDSGFKTSNRQSNSSAHRRVRERKSYLE